MLVYRKVLVFYYWSELSAIAEFIEEAEEERGVICRSKTSVSVHLDWSCIRCITKFPFSYKEWVSSPGLVISIDLTSLSSIGKGSSVNESIYYIPLLFPQSGPLLCIGLCFGAEVERSFGKVPNWSWPTNCRNALAWVSSSLRGSSLLTSFSEATFPFFDSIADLL